MDLHGFLVVDKPRGVTSHDVVALVRRRLRMRRVGHAGTLDPAASGVLVVAAGAATRLIDRVQDGDKQYVAHIVLGAETDSADAEGRLISAAPADVAAPSLATIEQALTPLIGTISQVPPAHSAIKVGGQALYHRARRGEQVEVPARTVTVHSIRVLAYDYPDLLLAIDCGKGVYVRSIARDLGRALGTGAYLHALLRTAVGQFTLGQAWTAAEIEELLEPHTWPLMALHPDVALSHAPALILDRDAATAWYHGRPVPTGRRPPDAPVEARVYDQDGSWLGVATADAERRRWRPRQVVAH